VVEGREQITVDLDQAEHQGGDAQAAHIVGVERVAGGHRPEDPPQRWTMMVTPISESSPPPSLTAAGTPGA